MTSRVDLKSLALAFGVVWGALMFLAALTAPFGWNAPLVTVMAGSYVGYAPGIAGAFIGLLWGFFDAAIGVIVIGLVYRWFAAHPIHMPTRVERKTPRV